MFNILPFKCFTTWGAANSHFLPGKGAAKYFLVPKDAVNQKRLKNTVLSEYLIETNLIDNVIF
jgi:hypothetical protein